MSTDILAGEYGEFALNDFILLKKKCNSLSCTSKYNKNVPVPVKINHFPFLRSISSVYKQPVI